MGAVDNISTELIARTKFNELTRKGMSEQQALERIKEANRPTPVKNANPFFDFDKEPDAVEDAAAAVADEISASLENLVGTTEDIAPKAAPMHPTESTTTSKFANLQFGRNYDPNNR